MSALNKPFCMICVKTNMGEIPLLEYYDIRAYQCGFDSFYELTKHGYSIDLSPEDLVIRER